MHTGNNSVVVSEARRLLNLRTTAMREAHCAKTQRSDHGDFTSAFLFLMTEDDQRAARFYEQPYIGEERGQEMATAYHEMGLKIYR